MASLFQQVESMMSNYDSPVNSQAKDLVISSHNDIMNKEFKNVEEHI